MVCPTTAFAAWDSMNLCVVLSFILQKGQKNYPAPKRELLAMLFGLRRWGEMLQPQEFMVEVDHKALVHLRSERSFMA